MAKLKIPYPLTGTLAGVSIYTRKDLPGAIARTPGGASKERIRHDPAFALTRRYNAEFSGRSTASKWLRRSALQPLEFLSDFNWAPALAGCLKTIQGLDTDSELGRRSVALSKNPSFLSEYALTRRQPFDRVVRTPVKGGIDKDNRYARVEAGALLPGVNFAPEGPYPLYRLMAVLGAVPDLVHLSGNTYAPHPSFQAVAPQSTESSWFGVREGSPATTLEVYLPEAPGTGACTLILSIALVFGTITNGESIEAVPNFGCAKILGGA